MDNLRELVEADLHSKDPGRILNAIKLLKEKMMNLEEIEIAIISPDIFIPFGDTVPEEAQLDFIEIISAGRASNSKLSAEDIICSMITLVLRYAIPYVSYYVALKLKITKSPQHAVKIAMQQIAKQVDQSPKAILGASHLVSRFLDGKDEARKATIEQLKIWPMEEAFLQVIEYIEPQLEDYEKKFLSINN